MIFFERKVVFQAANGKKDAYINKSGGGLSTKKSLDDQLQKLIFLEILYKIKEKDKGRKMMLTKFLDHRNKIVFKQLLCAIKTILSDKTIA